MLGAILAVELVQSTDWDKDKHKNKLAHFQILPWNGVIGMYRLQKAIVKSANTFIYNSWQPAQD